MFDNKDSRDAADRLGEIWDDVTRTGGDVASPEDRDAALAGRLQQMVPPLNETTRERMRARVLASQRGEAPKMTTTTIRPDGLIAPLPQQPRSIPRPHRADHSIMRIAAMILLALSIGAAWLGIRSFDGSDDPSTPVQGALFATPTSDQEVAFRETVLLHDVAPVGESRQFTARIQRITLPAGAEWAFTVDSLTVDANPMSFYVESGSLTVHQNGASTEVGLEGSFNNGVPSSVANNTADPVTFIQMILYGSNDMWTIPPDTATTYDFLGDVPVSQPFGSVTTLNFSRAFSNMPNADPIGVGDNETVALIAVNSGSMTVNVRAGSEIAQSKIGNVKVVPFAAASGGSITLNAGATLTANVGSSIDGSALNEGSDMLSAYVLTIQQQSPQDIAEQQLADGPSIDWTIPDGAESATMMVRVIALQPGVEWFYQFDGAAQYQVYSGNVSVELGNSGAVALTPGQYASQIGSGNLVIWNTGPRVAIIIQATIAIGNKTVEDMGGAVPQGVTINSSAIGQTQVDPGDVTITLGEQSIDNTSSQANDSEFGASLIFVSEGNALFTPLSGDIEIGRAHPTNGMGTPISDEPATSTSTTLLEGDSAVIPQDAAYLITGASEHVSRFIWFSFTPVDSDATPTPAPNTDFPKTPTPAAIAVDEAPSPTPAPNTEAITAMEPTPTPAS